MFAHRILRASAVMTLGTAGLIACSKSSDKSAATDSAAATASVPADSTASGTAAGNVDAQPSGTAATLTDANIVALLDAANANDSAAGSIAATKGTSADVKDFGKMM